MIESISDNATLIAITAVVAFGTGWLIKSALDAKKLVAATKKSAARIDDVVRHRNHLTTEVEQLRSSVEAQEAVISERTIAVNSIQTELDSALEKEKLLTRDLFTLRAEREDFKTKMSNFQNRMTTLQRQSSELQSEFVKARDFYVGELTKSFEKRKAVEEKLEKSQDEHDSLHKLLSSAKSEQESVNKMLDAATEKLEKLDVLEQSVADLEAENAELKDESARLQQEIDAWQRDMAAYEELKVQNEEMSQLLKSMEEAQKQYEEDANRYRERAEQQEKKSETLRMQLDQVEQNFLDMEQQQDKALKNAREATNGKAANEDNADFQEVDDLKEIVGIGKKFEEALNELGVVSFRQIANFEMGDIARVNAKLKEFKGRMEQDDWIGQARELLYKKYGAA